MVLFPEQADGIVDLAVAEEGTEFDGPVVVGEGGSFDGDDG